MCDSTIRTILRGRTESFGKGRNTFPVAAILVSMHRSDVDESSDSSSSESDEESSAPERWKDSDDNVSPPGYVGGNGVEPSELLPAEDPLLPTISLELTTAMPTKRSKAIKQERQTIPPILWRFKLQWQMLRLKL